MGGARNFYCLPVVVRKMTQRLWGGVVGDAVVRCLRRSCRHLLSVVVAGCCVTATPTATVVSVVVVVAKEEMIVVGVVVAGEDGGVVARKTLVM